MPHKIQIGGVLQDGSRPWTGTAITLHAGMHYIDTGDLEVLAWDQAFLFFPTGFSVGRVVNAVLQAVREREREREVYSFSQMSTSVSRATITTRTHDNEGYLDRNSNPDTTSLLPIIHSFDLSSARSRENPEPHKTTWEKASPQALRPSPPQHTAIVVIARLVFPSEVLSPYEGFTWDWRLCL